METVVAALEKKNVNSITCTWKCIVVKLNELQEGEKKYLQLKIEVHLDFLPAFEEDIVLEEKFVALNSSEDFILEVQELNESVEALEESSKHILDLRSGGNLQNDL